MMACFKVLSKMFATGAEEIHKKVCFALPNSVIYNTTSLHSVLIYHVLRKHQQDENSCRMIEVEQFYFLK